MGAVTDRLTISLEELRDYVHLTPADEGTAVMENLGLGNTGPWTPAQAPDLILTTLRVYAGAVGGALDLLTEITDYTVDEETQVITRVATGAIEDTDLVVAEYRYSSAVCAEDELILALYAAAKRAADEYLNNPFEEIIPQVKFTAVLAGHAITVDGACFTAADEKDEDKRYFKVGENDSETADNFCELVNSTTLGGSYGAVGIEGVIATNTDGTVKFTKRYPRVEDIVVTSSTATRLLVRFVRTELDIPDPVKLWCLLYVKRHFENRDGHLQKNVKGSGSVVWAPNRPETQGLGEDYTLISPLRLPVGF